MNRFYRGDCLFVMNHDIEPNSIDLIYLDPPFFTGKVQKGTKKWQPGSMEVSYEDSKHFWKEKGIASNTPEWLKHIALQRPDFAAYLFYMMERLQACKRVLKDTGSIYLHCDWRASHYLKMIMDGIFGYDNFRNEIVWHYPSMSRANNDFPKKHDTILRYSKSDSYVFQTANILVPYSQSTIDRAKYGGAGFEADKCEANYLKRDGKIPDTVWDIPHLKGKEVVGYPTQKPVKLLKRIIAASSSEGDTILDPFCGCGTAIIAAQHLNRQWIGIDISKDAYEISSKRHGELPLNFTHLEYITRDNDEVKALSPLEFEAWVNEYYKATKPTPDKGVDGIMRNGVPIQTKSYLIKYPLVSQFVTDIKFHPSVPKPVKKAIMVSQAGFDEGARQRKFEIESSEGIDIEFITPDKLLHPTS